jgi:hypothetical protein
VAVGFTSAAGRQELALFYLGQPRPGPEVIDRLSTTLPDFMVPPWHWQLDDFPLNDNQKVDRRVLAELAARRSGQLSTGDPAPDGSTFGLTSSVADLSP